MRCLLISCSDRKSTDVEPVPALERYDGPTFRIVRRYLRDHPGVLGTELLIGIISARHGLLHPEARILTYDLRMSRARARELQPQVIAALREWLSPYRELAVFVNLGKEYQDTIEPLGAWLAATDYKLTRARGGSGKKQQQLVAWLNGIDLSMPNRPSRVAPPSAPTGRAVLRGVAIAATPSEIEANVQGWLETGDHDYQRTKSWLAQVGPYAVSPKWLVSRLSGLPVSAFAADEARRVLAQLGISIVSHSRDRRPSG